MDKYFGDTPCRTCSSRLWNWNLRKTFCKWKLLSARKTQRFQRASRHPLVPPFYYLREYESPLFEPIQYTFHCCLGIDMVNNTHRLNSFLVQSKSGYFLVFAELLLWFHEVIIRGCLGCLSKCCLLPKIPARRRAEFFPLPCTGLSAKLGFARGMSLSEPF